MNIYILKENYEYSTSYDILLMDILKKKTMNLQLQMHRIYLFIFIYLNLFE